MNEAFWADLGFGVGATVIVAGFYWYAASTRLAKTDEMGSPYDPLVITAGVFGRASLSNLQILFFSLIVFWVLFYSVLKDGTLSKLSPDVLILLGIGAAGTAGAKISALRQQRLSFENWAWLKRKGWIQNDIGKARTPPTWADLVTSDDAFNVFKFQNIVVSLIVGIGLVFVGLSEDSSAGLASFEIDQSLLSLLGLSQATYVGGKAISASPVAELDKKLNELLKLERKFIEAVAVKWSDSAPPARDLAEAKKAAPADCKAYEEAALTAAVMLQERMGSVEPPSNTSPGIPA